jgi:hypothetical protein
LSLTPEAVAGERRTGGKTDNEVGEYLELLHRGEALVFTRKNGKKAYLSVQPEGRLLLHIMKPGDDPDPL